MKASGPRRIDAVHRHLLTRLYWLRGASTDVVASELGLTIRGAQRRLVHLEEQGLVKRKPYFSLTGKGAGLYVVNLTPAGFELIADTWLDRDECVATGAAPSDRVPWHDPFDPPAFPGKKNYGHHLASWRFVSQLKQTVLADAADRGVPLSVFSRGEDKIYPPSGRVRDLAREVGHMVGVPGLQSDGALYPGRLQPDGTLALRRDAVTAGDRSARLDVLIEYHHLAPLNYNLTKLPNYDAFFSLWEELADRWIYDRIRTMLVYVVRPGDAAEFGDLARKCLTATADSHGRSWFPGRRSLLICEAGNVYAQTPKIGRWAWRLPIRWEEAGDPLRRVDLLDAIHGGLSR